jgi:hypothetical protein
MINKRMLDLAGVKDISYIKYNEEQILNEIGELDNHNWPEEVKEKIKKILIDNRYTPEIVDMKNVENTDASMVNLSLDKIRELYAEDDEYVETFKGILKADKFPPPIVIDYKGEKTLLGGNRRAVAIVMKRKTSKIPVWLIKI